MCKHNIFRLFNPLLQEFFVNLGMIEGEKRVFLQRPFCSYDRIKNNLFCFGVGSFQNFRIFGRKVFYDETVGYKLYGYGYYGIFCECTGH